MNEPKVAQYSLFNLRIWQFIILIIFLFTTQAFAQEVGKITAVQGKVDILKGGKPPAVTAKINDVVHLNDIIRTKTDSKAEITFKDGTVIRIAPRSRVDISEYFTDGETLKVTLELPRGKVGAFVAEKSVEKVKTSPKTNRFEIKTPIAVAGVRGTKYIVGHHSTYSRVVVLEGRVYCYNRQIPDKIIDVGAGEGTIIREGALPSQPRRFPPGEMEREQRDITIGKDEGGKKQGPGRSPVTGDFEEFRDRKTSGDRGGEMRQPLTGTTPSGTENPPITETTNITEPLSINVTLQSIEPGSVKLNYNVSANRAVTVEYKDPSTNNWVRVNDTPEESLSFSIPVEPSSSYQIQIRATDNNGNIAEWTSSPLYPVSNSLSGNIVTDTSAYSEVAGAVAGALGNNKGMAKLTISSPVSFNSTFNAGGGDSTNGYWILKGPASSSYFRLLTPNYLFTGSGSSSVTLVDGGLKSIITGPWIQTSPLNLSATITGYTHYYDSSTNKIDEVPNSGFGALIGRTGQLILPANLNETITHNTGNYSLGYVPATDTSYPSMEWGIFQENSGSPIKLKGYAGFRSEQNYAFYGLYIGQDSSAGIIKGSPYGTNQNLYEDIHILDIEPSITFKKKATDYTTMNTWGDWIQGSYQGFFTGGSGTPTISQQDINYTSYGVISSKTLSLKKGDNPEPWGVFGIELGGSHTATSPAGFKLEFGGTKWDNRDASNPDTTPDYWVGWITDGAVSSGKMSGNFGGRFMTPTHYGKMEGKMLGDLGSNTWVGVVLGSYEPILELSHLSNIVSASDTSKIYKENFSATGARINAYLGGDSFWSSSSASLYSIGMITDVSNEVDFSQGKGYLWYAPVNWSSGSYKYSGYAGGRFAQRTDGYYNMSAYVAGIYNDSTNKGIFIGNLSADGAENVLQLEKRFFLEGENTVKAVTIDTGSIPSSVSPAVVSLLTADSNTYGITIGNQEGKIIMDANTNDYTFGAGLIGMGGTYTNAPSGSWEITYSGKFESDGVFGAILKGDTWGSENNVQNVIHGKTYGYFSDITGTPFRTGIFVGETEGTFDPNGAYKYWQTVTVGVALETAKFLSMACPGGTCNTSGTNFTDDQEKLRKLNIPVVEVGRVDLTYSNSSCTNCLTSVNMQNVIFFAPQTGQPPAIWATNNVSGSFNGTVSTGYPVTLTGGNLSVQFNLTVWDTSYNKWAATISGSGSISNYTIQDMKGAAAGTISGNNFSGTAAGVVKASP